MTAERMPPPGGSAAMPGELRTLGALVEQALALADQLRLSAIGIALDRARVDLTHLTRHSHDRPTP